MPKPPHSLWWTVISELIKRLELKSYLHLLQQWNNEKAIEMNIHIHFSSLWHTQPSLSCLLAVWESTQCLMHWNTVANHVWRSRWLLAFHSVEISRWWWISHIFSIMFGTWDLEPDRQIWFRTGFCHSLSMRFWSNYLNWLSLSSFIIKMRVITYESTDLIRLERSQREDGCKEHGTWHMWATVIK